MSTFGISQNFRATSIIGRIGRTAPEKVVEKVNEEEDYEEEDDEDEDEDEDDDSSKKPKAKSASVDVAKKSDEHVSFNKQFASFMNRYSEKTADHH